MEENKDIKNENYVESNKDEGAANSEKSIQSEVPKGAFSKSSFSPKKIALVSIGTVVIIGALVMLCLSLFKHKHTFGEWSE